MNTYTIREKSYIIHTWQNGVGNTKTGKFLKGAFLFFYSLLGTELDIPV